MPCFTTKPQKFWIEKAKKEMKKTKAKRKPKAKRIHRDMFRVAVDDIDDMTNRR